MPLLYALKWLWYVGSRPQIREDSQCRTEIICRPPTSSKSGLSKSERARLNSVHASIYLTHLRRRLHLRHPRRSSKTAPHEG